MEEFRIQQLARSTILVQASTADLALHLGFHCAHRFVQSRSCDILNHLIARDRKIDAERLRNSEHESITNLPVADLFAVPPVGSYSYGPLAAYPSSDFRFAITLRTANVEPDHGVLA